MSTSHRWDSTGEDLPQAIADDYPGWTVSATSGTWTASCPAVTVHAENAAALRTAIERAIWGEGGN